MKNKKNSTVDNSYKQRATDSIINNLKNPDIENEDGNFIKNKDNGSFSNINTAVYGSEVDVDDL